MTNQPKYLRAEYLLYALAFLLALALRLASLGSLPLTDAEASLALVAQDAARGTYSPGLPAQVGTHPAYTSLTTALMFLFSAGNWTARFWPALAGSLLVLMPLFFRKQLGRLPALLVAFFTAFDPLLLGISRQAGSQPLALLFTLLTAGLWLRGRFILAGISGAMTLLCGPGVWPGLATLLAAVLIDRALWKRSTARDVALQPAETVQPAEWRRAAAAALVTLLLAATLFFTLPNGLSALGASLTGRLAGWGQPSGLSPVMILRALLLYAFFPLVFGLWGAAAGWLRHERVDRFLLLWWVLALVPAIIYPGRQAADPAWSMLPLWGLAARQVARLFKIPQYDRLPAGGLALFSAVILTFISMTLIAVINNVGLSAQEAGLRLGGAVLMLVASALLVAWGWSRMVAWRGFVYGLALVLLAFMIMSGWHAGGLSSRPGRELLGLGSSPQNSDLLYETIGDLNRWTARESNGLDIVVLEVSQPSVRWLLRDYRRVSFVDALPETASPALVITPLRPELELAATYRGQSILYTESVDWNALQGTDWLRWLVFRTLNNQQRVQDRLILWARLDLFPGGLLEAQPALETGQQSPVMGEEVP